MADTPLSPHVMTRRDELIAAEVRRVVRAHHVVERADEVMTRERRRSLEAQESIAHSLDVLHEMFGLTWLQIEEMVTEAQRSKRQIPTDDDEDDE